MHRILEQHGFALVRHRGDHVPPQRQVAGSTVLVPVPMPHQPGMTDEQRRRSGWPSRE
jgi:predicted RNA binding protein YcfA (HicA-like mRNA interferase family)